MVLSGTCVKPLTMNTGLIGSSYELPAIVVLLILADAAEDTRKLVEHVQDICNRTRTCTRCNGIYLKDAFDKKGVDRHGAIKLNARCKWCVSEYKYESRLLKVSVAARAARARTGSKVLHIANSEIVDIYDGSSPESIRAFMTGLIEKVLWRRKT